ncbi:MAG: choice-of-anchor D domain-containing protein [Acidobacteria bacterium]|nr:choice-of-anchor D domain-containing protein [Acidobacteriota bacterium]
MTKLAALATIVLAFFFLFIVPQPNRAARIDGSPTMTNSNGPTTTSFDCPGAGTGALQGTGGISSNSAGTIAGFCVLAGNGNVAHGFVRAADGTITLFDAPGAGTGMNQGTFPIGINAGGVITGMFSDTNNVYRGFVRAAGGTITTFNAPGANVGGHAGTTPMSINKAGTITGMYRDPALVYHGFVRTAGGTITSFDAPGAGTGYVQGTQPLSINTAGTITGYYKDANYVDHGFVRAANGTFTVIDAPGAGTTPGQVKGLKFQGTIAIAINAGGVIIGVWADPNFANHGFVRAANGTIGEFDAPGAGGAGTVGTVSGSINTAGVIAGVYQDANGVSHGFQRATDATITSFDAPGAGGSGIFQGTVGVSINDSSAITGFYADANNVFHGYLLTPATAASASLSPTSLSFGNQAIDTTSAVKKITLTSSGTANLTLSNIAITGANAGDFAQTNNCPANLAPGKKCTINVTFAPSHVGSRSASLTLTDNAADSPQNVPLTGKGIAQATVSPTSLTFALQTVGTTSAAKNVTLHNNLAAKLTVNSIAFTGANAGDFAETNTCGGSVPAKGKCTISVTFTPAATGTRTATLTVSDSANNSPQTVLVTGTGK